MGINLASYVGATQVRRMVIGDEDRAPTPAELERMKALVREAMREGAVGLSTSLQYAPAPYAKTEELIALAAEAAKFGGIYASHIRDEGDAIMPALDEAFRIGREAAHSRGDLASEGGRQSQLGTHAGNRGAHRAGRAKSGVDVAADTYAYPAGFNTFSAVIPPWAHDGGDKKLIERLKDPAMRARIRKEMETPSGDWNNEWQEVTGPESFLVGAVQNPKLLPLQGKSIAEIAKLWNKDPIDTVFDLLIEDEAFTEVAMFGMSEPDVALALQQPWVSDLQRFAGHGARRLARQGASASARLRHVSAHPAQVRPRGKQAHAGGRHPQVHGAAGAAHALRGSRRAESGDVGRRGGLRPGDHSRRGDLRRVPTSFRKGCTSCW